MFGSRKKQQAEQTLIAVVTQSMEQTHEAMQKLTEFTGVMVKVEQQIATLEAALVQHMTNEEKVLKERLEVEKQLGTMLDGLAKAVSNIKSLFSEHAIESEANLNAAIKDLRREIMTEVYSIKDKEVDHFKSGLTSREDRFDKRLTALETSINERDIKFDERCASVSDSFSEVRQQIQGVLAKLDKNEERWSEYKPLIITNKEDLITLKTDHKRVERIGLGVATAGTIGVAKALGLW